MGAATILFDEVKRKGIKIIDEWVYDIQREDLHLDFKRKTDPSVSQPEDSDKRNFSRALSGFANSDGGLIVWGVDAPSSGSGTRARFPIADVSAFAEHLDSMVSRLVAPMVEGVENYVIYDTDQHDTGYVISYIPLSVHSPHRAEHHATKRYYQRSGDSFVMIEHWQLEYMFGRRQAPLLRVAWDIIPQHKIQEGEPMFSDRLVSRGTKGSQEWKQEALLRISIQNKGKALAQYCCLRIRYKTNHERYHYNARFRYNLLDYDGTKNALVKPGVTEVTARALPGLVIYPSDRLAFYEFRFNYSQKEVQEGGLPDFILNYDLFAENVRALTSRRLTIPGSTMSRILAD